MYTYLLHGVLHEFIQVLVDFNGILILKITTKCKHDLVGSKVASLEEDVLDEGIHTVLHIVVKQVRVILYVQCTCSCTCMYTHSNYMCTIPIVQVQNKMYYKGTTHGSHW